MKKILAGVLAAVSMLSVATTAFAATDEKTVTKPGEVGYDVAVAAPKVVLNLVMPAKMSAALNPYGADIQVGVKDDGETKVTAKNGIQSAAYKVVNNTEDYGVYIDATATTTVTTTDKTKWTVKEANDGTKGAALALSAAATPDAFSKLTVPTASSAATSATAQGALVLDSTAAADKDKGLVAGQVQQKKMIYLAATTDTESPATTYMGFLGTLAQSTTGNNAKEVVWNEDDTINVNLVLKVSAGPKTFS